MGLVSLLLQLPWKPLNTPFPSYYGLQVLSKVAQPGDTLVKAGSDNLLVSVHAARNADGDLSVELVNKDPNTAYVVKLDYAGWTPSSAAPTVCTYGDEAASITGAQHRARRARRSSRRTRS